jgi:Rieske Fe-S protein
VAVNPQLIRADPKHYRAYASVLLVHADGTPLKTADLEVGVNYVFAYPFTQTPCFLIDLGKPTETAVRVSDDTGSAYAWPGGVGSKESIVSYSAICTHKLSHPAKTISFISYRHNQISYVDKHNNTSVDKQGLIFCCSERSAYDPARGGQVLGGPAPLPLTAVEIAVYDDDTISANGTYGADVYDRFFDTFGPRFALEQGNDDFIVEVRDTTIVALLSEYSRTSRMC